jgi:hypothetical protein
MTTAKISRGSMLQLPYGLSPLLAWIDYQSDVFQVIRSERSTDFVELDATVGVVPPE